MSCDKAILFCRFYIKKEIGKSQLVSDNFPISMAILIANYFLSLRHYFVVLFLVHHLYHQNVVLLVLLHYSQTGN